MIYLPGRGESYLALSPPRSTPSGVRLGRPQHFKVLRRKRNGGGDGQEQYASEIGLRTVWVYHVPESEQDRARDRATQFSCADKVEFLIHMYQKKEN